MTPKMTHIQTHYDYKEIYGRIQQMAEKLKLKGFSPDHYQYNILIACISWVIRDAIVAENFGLDLNKGLLFMGPPNSGKTRLMECLSKIVILNEADAKPFKVCHCSMISDLYSQEGRKAIQPYSFHHPPDSYCFDGLGKELMTSYYSQQFEVMNKVLLDRADLYSLQGTITHLTTHLTSNQIENRYGSEVRAKMKFMFNQVSFN